MKTFVVTYHQTIEQTLEVRVEAKDAKQAEKKADEFLNDPENGEIEWTFEDGTEPDVVSVEEVMAP